MSKRLWRVEVSGPEGVSVRLFLGRGHALTEDHRELAQAVRNLMANWFARKRIVGDWRRTDLAPRDDNT